MMPPLIQEYPSLSLVFKFKYTVVMFGITISKCHKWPHRKVGQEYKSIKLKPQQTTLLQNTMPHSPKIFGYLVFTILV